MSRLEKRDQKQVNSYDEIDLHDHTITEALSSFISYYNARVARGNKKQFKVIHGYGSSGSGGKIRVRLRKYLARFPEHLDVIHGEKFLGNPGVTFIVPWKALPTEEDGFAAEILSFCVNGKSEEKIIGKFRRYGQLEVKAAIKGLQRKGRLRSFYKGKYKYYQTRSE
ncbi:MAG: Smr/MutS family protein [Anaerolineaceae bacterium]|nr:Smr/MutS family protein [Anaerolineaceae bacterium]